MASDLSDILKKELSNTLEQLLSKGVSIDDVVELTSTSSQLSDMGKFIQVDIKFTFNENSPRCTFFIPSISATKFEYFMLGGVTELKEDIDNEISDAINEIVSNICGSFSTVVNAQNFKDIGTIKFEIEKCSICDLSAIEPNKLYNFLLSIDNEKLPIILYFDDLFLPFFSGITGKKETTQTNNTSNDEANNKHIEPPKNNNVGINSLLNENATNNLQLLFNIKLKLSVRLGTKHFLLKDILRWDVGEIIELEQMVNEPLEILVNGVKIGEGEAVIVEGKFGLKVKSIGNKLLGLNQLGLN